MSAQPVNAEDTALRRLIDRVATARAARTPMQLRGHGSKDFYGETARGEALDMASLSGITRYEPTELVVTVRAGTAVQRGNHFARVQRAGRIERRLHAEHQRAFGLAELHAHRVELLDTDAVFAGDGAAERDAELENVGAEGLGAVQLIGIVGVEQDQRMEIAVTGMEDVDHA